MKKRTKDQQIKHLKAMIGGYIRALRDARYVIEHGSSDNPRWERRYHELYGRLSTAERLRLDAEDQVRICYEQGVFLPGTEFPKEADQ